VITTFTLGQRGGEGSDGGEALRDIETGEKRGTKRTISKGAVPRRNTRTEVPVKGIRKKEEKRAREVDGLS